MDIDVMQKEITRLKAFERDARPMLAEWQAHKAKERIGADPVPMTAAETDRRAATILAHTRTISRLVSAPLTPHAPHAPARPLDMTAPHGEPSPQVMSEHPDTNIGRLRPDAEPFRGNNAADVGSVNVVR